MAIIPRNIWLPKPLHRIRVGINRVWRELVERPLNDVGTAATETMREFSEKNKPRENDNFRFDESRDQRNQHSKPNQKADNYEETSTLRKVEQPKKQVEKLTPAQQGEKILKYEANQYDKKFKLAEEAKADYERCVELNDSNDPRELAELLNMAKRYVEKGQFNRMIKVKSLVYIEDEGIYAYEGNYVDELNMCSSVGTQEWYSGDFSNQGFVTQLKEDCIAASKQNYQQNIQGMADQIFNMDVSIENKSSGFDEVKKSQLRRNFVNDRARQFETVVTEFSKITGTKKEALGEFSKKALEKAALDGKAAEKQ